MSNKPRHDLDALRQKPAGELTPSELAALLAAHTSDARARASQSNGRRGGRPVGSLKPLPDIACTCGADMALTGHKALCPRGRAIKRRGLAD